MTEKVVIGNAELWHGDCREILPTLPECDAIVTDPPYPDYHIKSFCAEDFRPEMLREINVHQFVFWSAKAEFPLDYSAIHIWHKTGSGDIASYERIFERNGGKSYLVFEGNPISNETMARFARDIYTGHLTQKPVSLMIKIVHKIKGNKVCDPFMGSGTTGVACVNLGKQFTGIERERKYFDIACERIARAQEQGRLFA